MASTIDHIDDQIDDLLAELSLEQERSDPHDEELEDLYFEASALKERMTNVVKTYHLA